MLKDLISFASILAIILICSTCFFYLLYSSKLYQFSTLGNSFIENFSRILGSFDFTDHNAIALALSIFYLFLSAVIILNLLVAIMSNTYSSIYENSNMEYAIIVYDDFYYLKFHKKFSSIIAYTNIISPISLLSTFFVVFSIKKRKLVNNYLITFGYFIFYLLPILAVFMALNLICVPFAWILYF
jgi:hypothetical protein